MATPVIIWRNAVSQNIYQLASKLEKTVHEPSATDAQRIGTVRFQLASAKEKAVEGNQYDPSVLISFVLGVVFMAGLTLGFQSSHYYDFGFYLSILSVFHLLEYLYVSVFHPKDCSSDSFLLTHSTEAQLAIAAAFVEYWIESFLFPSLKAHSTIIYPSLLLVLLCQAIRTLAQWTAQANFHHLIREHKDPNHHLVTTGIYAFLRHPSYFGWFWWSLFTQVLLANPICFVLYSYLSWRFFEDRITDEEVTLVRFFGKDYEQYRKRVPIGIPFIATK